MKRLSFFKVYGRVDPRLEEARRPKLEFIPFFRMNYDAQQRMIGTAAMFQPYRHPQYDYLMGRESAEPFRQAVISALARRLTHAADSRAYAMIASAAFESTGELEPPVETVEAIREREKQNFLCNQRNAKMMAQPTTQRKIDRMFGRHDPSGRKESLAHHARAIRLKLEAKGMDTKEVERFIAGLGLDEK